MKFKGILLALFFLFGFVVHTAAQQAAPLQPGDQISISVWQDPKLNRSLIIGPDGTISFPLAGHIKAAGLTPQALENLLRKRLQKNYTEPLDINVSLAALNPQEEYISQPKFYITGEVLKPGPYVLKPVVNVMQAIALAGGMGPFAAKERIQVHRKIHGVDSIFIFDYNTYASGKDTAQNINVRPGDIIIVPERGLFE